MIAVVVTYVLRNGVRGQLFFLASSTGDAIDKAFDTFPGRVRFASAKKVQP